MFKTHLRRSNRRNTPSVRLQPNEGSIATYRQGRCVALVDARCLSWLTQPTDDRSGSQPLVPSAQHLHMMGLSLGECGLNLDLIRAYWYTDQPQTQPVDDVIQRTVNNPDGDGGQSLVRAMAQDLAQLAAHRAVEHVLLVSDDERLWSAVDQAQLRGIAVHIAMDDSGTDLARLIRDDPSWARFLAQADRRVQLLTPDEPASGVELGGEGSGTMPDDLSALEASIQGHLNDWWAEEDESQRLDLQDELRHVSMGLPQEVDRKLLLRLSRLLGHPLTWPEKKVMRRAARALVLGETAPVTATETPMREP